MYVLFAIQDGRIQTQHPYNGKNNILVLAKFLHSTMMIVTIEDNQGNPINKQGKNALERTGRDVKPCWPQILKNRLNLEPVKMP